MTRTLKTVLAAAALALSLSAQALTLTPQTPTVGLVPGGSAVAKFDVDLEGAVLELMAVQLDFLFDTGLLASGAAESITLSFSGGTGFPEDFIVISPSGTGASFSWITDGLSLAQVSGAGVLSIKLSDLGLAAGTPLRAELLLSSMDEDISANATLSVVPLPVPEPASWALALAGGCLLIAVRRRVGA